MKRFVPPALSAFSNCRFFFGKGWDNASMDTIFNCMLRKPEVNDRIRSQYASTMDPRDADVLRRLGDVAKENKTFIRVFLPPHLGDPHRLLKCYSLMAYPILDDKGGQLKVEMDGHHLDAFADPDDDYAKVVIPHIELVEYLSKSLLETMKWEATPRGAASLLESLYRGAEIPDHVFQTPAVIEHHEEFKDGAEKDNWYNSRNEQFIFDRAVQQRKQTECDLFFAEEQCNRGLIVLKEEFEREERQRESEMMVRLYAIGQCQREELDKYRLYVRETCDLYKWIAKESDLQDSLVTLEKRLYAFDKLLQCSEDETSRVVEEKVQSWSAEKGLLELEMAQLRRGIAGLDVITPMKSTGQVAPESDKNLCCCDREVSADHSFVNQLTVRTKEVINRARSLLL